MKYTYRCASPVQQSDGSWKVVLETITEDIEDLHRHRAFCSKCANKDYPACRAWCPLEKPPAVYKNKHHKKELS